MEDGNDDDEEWPVEKREQCLSALQQKILDAVREADSAKWENPFFDEQAERDFLEIDAMEENGVDEATVTAREDELLFPHVLEAKRRAESIMSDPSRDPNLRQQAKCISDLVSLMQDNAPRK